MLITQKFSAQNNVSKIDGLNYFSKVNEEALASIAQTDQNAELDASPDLEVTKTVNQISNGKAPGSVSTPAEENKKGRPLWTFEQTHSSVPNHMEG